MRQHVLHFVAKLLTKLKAPIAGHTSVYPSLQVSVVLLKLVLLFVHKLK
jgi:hypothetical protein